jgi:catechol 2,3-dioxygenase-like lactoylglutathione lyase family enzyme
MKPKKHDPSVYPETFHVGFYVRNAAAVHTKHNELAAAGLSPGEIRGADRNNMRGTHFYCTAPGGVLVEIANATEPLTMKRPPTQAASFNLCEAARGC